MTTPLNDQTRNEREAQNNSIVQSTVGLTGSNELRMGTGSLIEFGGHEGILTADHVIDGARIENLRFMAPDPDPMDSSGAIRPVTTINILDVFQDSQRDLAFLRLGEPPGDPRFTNFRTVPEADVPTPVGWSALMLGYPAQLSQRVGQNVLAAVRRFEQPTIVPQDTIDPSAEYDPNNHFLVAFPPEGLDTDQLQSGSHSPYSADWW